MPIAPQKKTCSSTSSACGEALPQIPPEIAPGDEVGQPVVPLDGEEHAGHQIDEPEQSEPDRRNPQPGEEEGYRQGHPGQEIEKGEDDRPPFPQAGPFDEGGGFQACQGEAKANHYRQDGDALGVGASGD